MSKLGDQRLRLIVALSLVAFLIVAGRAVQLQVVEASSLSAKVSQQQEARITLPASRASIVDDSGRPLAVMETAEDLMVHPALVRNPVTTADFIAQMEHIKGRKALRREVTRLEALLQPKGVTQAIVLRQASPDLVKAILKNHPPGLFSVPEPRREYPFGRLAPQLLGYTDINNVGQGGLEQQYNRYLQGRPGQELQIMGPGQVPLETLTLRRRHPGHEVHLTIDQVVQSKVQAVMNQTAQKWRAHSATAIVLNPRNGNILAMVSSPSYDNNDVHNLTPAQFQRMSQNEPTNYTYEPGSTFKVVTMTAALTAGIVYPEMKFANLPYQIHVGDRWIHDDAPRGPKTFTAAQILAQSSNVGTVTIAQMVGKKLLSHWIDRFGFGQMSELGFPGESPGIVLPPDKWYSSSIGNIPIGQGISVTPIQMASMYATIANHGVLVQPHVVSKIDGVKTPPPTRRRIIGPHVDGELVNMLEGVVDSALGTGVLANIPGYSVAGKTGTAQKANGQGGYSTTNYVASFIGFLPAHDPRVEVLVVVDSPRGNIYGGSVAAPAFQQIGSFLTQVLSIPPDRPAH